MNSEEYEQKKAECWKEFEREYIVGQVQWHPVGIYDAFSYAFDRAFALGKQTETVTQEEIEDAADSYADKNSKTENDWSDLYKGYCQGMKDALGKQEKEADTVIQGWVARDEDENLFMYNTKPERDETIHMWMGECANIDLRNHLFPDLTWDDDPEPAEIIIKRKKK